MSETTETSENQEQLEIPQDLDVGQSFNLLVNLARQTKLTYDEHALVDKAVKVLSEKLEL
tara:strand:+ start:889 stop:1068 length:180 start_codon:yes stop_codon:yes gene_type:complete